jgi:hypothetical protein
MIKIKIKINLKSKPVSGVYNLDTEKHILINQLKKKKEPVFIYYKVI